MIRQEVHSMDAQPTETGGVRVLFVGRSGPGEIVFASAADALTFADLVHLAAERARKEDR